MPAPAKVSVVIPAYNAEETIEASVRSALEQTSPPSEVIVVDDGSTDGTRDVLASFGSRITVVAQANGGLAAARNAGLATARGDLIAWLDGDDIARPERFEVQAAVLAAEPSAAIVASDFDAFGEGDLPTPRYARRYYCAIEAPDSLERILGARKQVTAAGRTWPYHRGEARLAIVTGNFLHPPTVMLRRSAVERAGLLSVSFPTSEDWLYFVEVTKHGHVAFIDEPLLDYRISEGQMSRKMRSVRVNNLGSFRHLLDAEPELMRAHPELMRGILAYHEVSLADHLGEGSALAALPHWVAGARLGASPRALAKALARMMIPGSVARALLKLRGRSTTDWGRDDVVG